MNMEPVKGQNDGGMEPDRERGSQTMNAWGQMKDIPMFSLLYSVQYGALRESVQGFAWIPTNPALPRPVEEGEVSPEAAQASPDLRSSPAAERLAAATMALASAAVS